MRTARSIRFALAVCSCDTRSFALGVAIFLIGSVLLADPAAAAALKVMKTGLGTGTITSSPAGINCGGDCDETFGSVNVTLTATAAAGSTFAGWDQDPDGDPATTPDCSGASNTCTVSMSVARSVRPKFNLAAAIPPITDLTPAGLTAYLAANTTTVTSAARFMSGLPDPFKQNWILMFRSESLQTGTAEFPRILMPNADATAVFTLGLATHDAYPGAHPDAIEYMQWDPVDKNFRFHEIVVADIGVMDADGDGVGVIPARPRGVYVDEPRCTRCHSTRNVPNPGTAEPGRLAGTTGITPGIVKAKNKPNWDTYDSWGGMSPFNRDHIFQGSVEAAALRKFFNPWTWRTNPTARSIIEQLKLQPPGVASTNAITRRRGGANDGHVNFAFDASPPVLTEPMPSGAGSITTNYNFNGTASGTATTVTQGGSLVRMQHADTPTSSEGRGVQLFDLLGGADGSLNAQRIVDELIDHKFATGSFPNRAIDVRPVALAVSRSDCLAISGSMVTSTTSTPLTIDLSFFNSRHGMTIDKLVADTLARARSMPRRKADIQKLNLDRSGDVYLVSPTNGLIAQYGAATSGIAGGTGGLDTSLARLRQEVFRRSTSGFAGDTTAMMGIYVDRELYGPRIDRTALYRYFLEPLGVSVDKWSMGVRGRSRTYTFADVFSYYLNVVLIPQLTADLNARKPAGLSSPATWDASNCDDLIEAVNVTLAPARLPPVNDVPTYTDVQRIFNKSCIECHGNLDYPPYANYSSSVYEDTLDLSEYETPAPGTDRLDHSHAVALSRSGATPATSFLYQRITADYALIDSPDPNANDTRAYDPAVISENCPNFTRLMPCGGPPLSQADILTVRRWVLGANPNTRGDPHIKTIDGINYDFQAAGEFVLLRGQGLEVQARQTAVETDAALGPNPHTGLTSCVSVNSAVAVRVGKHRITYQPNLSGAPDPGGLQLRIDGKLTKMGASGVPLASGGRIMPTTAPGGIQIEAAGGSVIVITPGWWNHYQLWYMNIDASHVRATQGVMGTIAPGSWLPALPDGSSLGPRPKDLQQRYRDLYEKFGDAWRVSDTTSLFDYAPGTSSATFTITSWPLGESPQACTLPRRPDGVPVKPPVKALSLEVAQQHCKAIVADDARANCIADVRVTGEPGFAKTYLLGERIERNGKPAAPDLVSPKDGETGLVKPVGFTWNEAPDADGDTVTYRFCLWPVGQRLDANECDAASIQTFSPEEGIACALLVLLFGALLLVVLFFMGMRNKPISLILAALVVLIAAILAFYFCGRGTASKVVTELESGKRYYWKVIAEDGKGAMVESRTRRFEVK